MYIAFSSKLLLDDSNFKVEFLSPFSLFLFCNWKSGDIGRGGRLKTLLLYYEKGIMELNDFFFFIR